jgi:hypothetical protein
VKSIRVLLASLSPFREDVVRRIVEHEPDMTLIGELVAEGDILSGGAAQMANVVIAGMDEERLPALCAALLRSQPGLRLIAMEERDGDAVLYEMRPQRIVLGNLSRAELVAAIRDGSDFRKASPRSRSERSKSVNKHRSKPR